MTEQAEVRSIYDYPVTFVVYTTKGDMRSDPVEWEDRIVSYSFGLPTGCYVNRWVAAHPDGTILQERSDLMDYIAPGQKYTIVLGGSEPHPEDKCLCEGLDPVYGCSRHDRESPGHPGETND